MVAELRVVGMRSPRNRFEGVMGLVSLLMLLALLMPGCLGMAGLVAGPVSGPISAVKEDQSWGAVLWSIPFGMFMGFMRGIEKDKDFFATGSYVTPGTLRVSQVFEPVANLKDPKVYPPESAAEEQ